MPRAAERRLVTCLFVDIVGSTELVMSGPPERTKRALDEAFARVRETVEGHGGTLEKYVGDAVFALFGAPVAHSDDPARAVRTASEIRDALTRQGLVVREGIETGDALVDVASAEHERQRMVIGGCVNIAARLQAAAAPGDVLIGPTCREAVAGVVEVVSLGELALKGIGMVASWRVVGLRPHAPAALVPFVGREVELGVLREAMARARRGSTTLALLVGAPGVGKSRLANDFVDGLSDVHVLRARCRPGAETGSPNPLQQLLSEGELSRDGLERALGLAMPKEDAARVAAVLTSTAGLDTADVLPSNPVERQDEIVSAWRRYIAARAAGRPIVLVVEDVHWAETQLVGILHRLALGTSQSLLVIATARPEFGDAWDMNGPGRIRVELGPLDPIAARRLAASVGGEGSARAIDRAEGNPLFVLELARSRRQGRELPVTLRGAIAARLDELPRQDREVLHRVAVVGETFDIADAVLLSDRDDRSVAAALARMAQGAYINPVDGRHRFQHGLVRDAAYGALPIDERMRLHARYAQHGVRPDDAEVLSHHWREALRLPDADWVWEGNPELPRMRAAARIAHRVTGDRLAHRFAHEQAVEAYGHALALSDDPLERAEIELAIGAAYARNARGDEAWKHRMIAVVEFSDAGASAPARAYADALATPIFNYGFMKELPPPDDIRSLLDEGERVARASQDYHALSQLLLQRAFYQREPGLADEAERLIERAKDRHAFADVLQRLALVRYSSGDLIGAERVYTQVGDLLRSGARVDELEYLCFRAVARSMLGELDGAEELATEAMRVTRVTGPHLRTHACHAQQWLLTLRGDWMAVELLARETLQLVETARDSRFCWRAAGAIGAGAIAAALAGRQADAAFFAAAAEPLTSPGAMRIATLLLPLTIVGRDAGEPLTSATIFDPARIADPIAAAMRGRMDAMRRQLGVLDASAATGVRVAGAIAAALRDEIAGRHDHFALLALGLRGLSDLIKHRVPEPPT